MIISVPNKSSITGLNDYRPVALMSVVMKSFKGQVLTNLGPHRAPPGPPADCLPRKQVGG